MTHFERLLAIMLKPGLIIGSIVFLTISFFYLDQPIAYYFNHFQSSPTFLVLFQQITRLGMSEYYLVLFFVAALFFRYIYRDKTWEGRSWFLWLCIVFPNLICLVLKILLGRARPGLLFENPPLYGFYGPHLQSDFWSFPSGHASTVMGLFFGLSVLFPRYFYAFMLSGLVVILSRLMLTYHFLSDVVSAAYLALLEVGLLMWLKKGRFRTTFGNF